MSYDDDHSSDPEVTPPPYDVAAERAWKHADEQARELGKKIERGFERFGGRLEQTEARLARFETQLHGLHGADGRGGEIGRVNNELAEGRSTRRWVLGQGLGLGAAIIAGAIALYTQLASMQVGLESVRERQQAFEVRVERTLDKLEARAAAAAPAMTPRAASVP
jgi:hypothetical protein